MPAEHPDQTFGQNSSFVNTTPITFDTFDRRESSNPSASMRLHPYGVRVYRIRGTTSCLNLQPNTAEH